MGKYRNEFGSIINVDDELAERIGHKWKPYDPDAEEQATASSSATEVPEGDPDESWSLAQLKALAAEEDVDIKGLRTKGAILDALLDEPDDVDAPDAADLADRAAERPAEETPEQGDGDEPEAAAEEPAEGDEEDEDGLEVPVGDPDESWTLPALKALAAEEGLDIKGLRSKADILAAFAAADEADDEPADDAPADGEGE